MLYDFTLLEYFIILVSGIAVLGMFDLLKTAIKEGLQK